MIFSHTQGIDREPNLYFKSYIIKDVFKGMKNTSIKEYQNKPALSMVEEEDEDVNESRIRVLQSSGSPSKRSQTHRQSQ